MRSVDGGLLASLFAGRRGRTTSSPPQFGHFPPRTFSAHEAQKVHSKEQIRASADSGGRSVSQHSQFGLSCSMSASRKKNCVQANPLTRSGQRPSVTMRLDLVVRSRMTRMARYSGDAHHSLNRAMLGNSRITHRFGDQVPSRTSVAPPRAR